MVWYGGLITSLYALMLISQWYDIHAVGLVDLVSPHAMTSIHQTRPNFIPNALQRLWATTTLIKSFAAAFIISWTP